LFEKDKHVYDLGTPYMAGELYIWLGCSVYGLGT